MPYPVYSIGDYINHDIYGKGIVVGLQIRDGQPVHHVRFFTKSHTFKYVRDDNNANMQLLQKATPDYIKTAQNLLLDLFKESHFRDQYRWVGESLLGDVIRHPIFGECLIIGTDERGFHGNKRRHAYSYNLDLFCYIDGQNFPILKISTEESRKQVHQLWLTRVLPQPFDIDRKDESEHVCV